MTDYDNRISYLNYIIKRDLIFIILGDFAVMIATGLTHGNSLFLITIVMLPMYAGMIVGATLGQLMDLTRVIFAISAAMFLFISLTELVSVFSKKNNWTSGSPRLE